MATWREVTESEAEFASRIRTLLEAHKHKTIATLRKDGSPRISGIEADFVGDDLWFGSMPDALKARDLQRDPRFALHSASIAPEGEGEATNWGGDAKLSGLAVEVTDPAEIKAMLLERGIDPEVFGGSHFFKADIREVVWTGVVGSQLRIELWRPGRPLHQVDRS